MSRIASRIILAAAALALSLALPAHAQNLGDLVNRGIKKAQRKVEDKIVDTVTRPVENAVNGRTANGNSVKATPANITPPIASGADIAGTAGSDDYLAKTCDGTSAALLPPARAAIFSANSPNISAADAAAERKVIAAIDGVLSAWRPNGYTVRPEAEYLNDSQGRVGNADTATPIITT